MLDLAHIGERIRECRKKKMMTIRVLGEYTGLSAGYLSMLEQNKTSRMWTVLREFVKH